MNAALVAMDRRVADHPGLIAEQALVARRGERAAIGQALAAGGDVQIYDCAVGEGVAGRAFVGELRTAPLAVQSPPSPQCSTPC